MKRTTKERIFADVRTYSAARNRRRVRAADAREHRAALSFVLSALNPLNK